MAKIRNKKTLSNLLPPTGEAGRVGKQAVKSKKNKKTAIKKYPLWLIVLAIFFVILISSIIFLFGYQKVYAQKVYPGVKVDELELNGMTREQVQENLKELTDNIYKQGLGFVYKDKEVFVSPIIASLTDPDIFREILTFDVDQTAQEVFAIGHSQDFWLNLKQTISSLFTEKIIDLSYELDEEELKTILEENFKSLESPGQNAQLIISFSPEEEESEENKEEYKVEIISEKWGKVFDYNLAVQKTTENIKNLENKNVSLALITDYPKIEEKNIDKALNKIDNFLNLAPVTLKYKDNVWQIDKKTLASLLEFQLIDQKVSLGLNQEKTFLQLEKISLNINIPTQDAKFEIKDGKVTQFQNSQTGLTLDIENSYQKINSQLSKEGENEIELIIEKIEPKIVTASTNNLGIKELIGVGESDFSGSPQNRRHNIKVGADSLNGILIKPDEEFSLITALGKIDASTDYLPELVIKGNKTIPEYGGGLCQVATTAFRVALDAGIPITERKSHSYRVSYYEPAGTDATIYSPHPDLKFINNTGNYILFQTRIDGNKLIFEFWGTSDGRKTEMTEPEIFNFVRPAPTKIIETEDLAPGQKKCTERAHTGADTKFVRTITYINGEVEEEVWTSRYRPWQEVCLLGVEPGTLDKDEEDAEEEATEENSEEQ